jgi:hypothetical protein
MNLMCSLELHDWKPIALHQLYTRTTKKNVVNEPAIVLTSVCTRCKDVKQETIWSNHRSMPRVAFDRLSDDLYKEIFGRSVNPPTYAYLSEEDYNKLVRGW